VAQARPCPPAAFWRNNHAGDAPLPHPAHDRVARLPEQYR
jgi:hypothetical protein